MSTVPFPRPNRPHLVPTAQSIAARLPLDAGKINLTIRRISKGHHGRTLEMLGHAAEHLVHSRRFLEARGSAADTEAIHILRRLSSEVFREYADGVKVRRPVEDFVMGCASWLLE